MGVTYQSHPLMQHKCDAPVTAPHALRHICDRTVTFTNVNIRFQPRLPI